MIRVEHNQKGTGRVRCLRLLPEPNLEPNGLARRSIRQYLCKLRVVPGGFDEVQQLLVHQIFLRVAKSRLLLYVQRGFALFNELRLLSSKNP